MKKKILTMTLIIMVFTVAPLFSQGVAPPPPGPSNTGNTSNGGGAPIGGGLFVLLGMGVAYAGKKIYDYKKQE